MAHLYLVGLDSVRADCPKVHDSFQMADTGYADVYILMYSRVSSIHQKLRYKIRLFPTTRCRIRNLNHE